MKKLILIASTLTLVACNAPTVEELVENPELLTHTLDECEELYIQDKNTDTAKCNNAMKAAKTLMGKAGKTFNKAKVNSQIFLDDVREKSPEVMGNLEESASKAFHNTKDGVGELYNKVKGSVED